MSSSQLDILYNNAKEFDIQNSPLDDLEREAKVVREYLKSVAVDNYKKVHMFFYIQATENSSDPYQEVVDNYCEFENILNNYKQLDEHLDYMGMAIRNILLHLKTAKDSCHSWLKEEFYDHFQYMLTCMNYWKGVLEEKGGYTFDY
tara:strand:- start:67 stop:504 length:438 start_codon:yes stop_codon:yes gene_type:complete